MQMFLQSQLIVYNHTCKKCHGNYSPICPAHRTFCRKFAILGYVLNLLDLKSPRSANNSKMCVGEMAEVRWQICNTSADSSSVKKLCGNYFTNDAAEYDPFRDHLFDYTKLHI
mmetsp:Transcript_121588/g.221190  ORF Transcript_121588/g.221190 Transcript_121588/m.221190 type:complete len:113 (+) Transcript_121588:775-1113(+)